MNRFPIHRKWTALVTGLVLSFMLAAPVTAQMMPETFSGLAEKAQSSVVNIRTVKVTKQSDRVFRHFFGPFQQRRPGDENNPFHDFFGPFGRQEPPSREFRQQSLGSGFMLDSDGYIVTNNHVVEDADEIKVRLTNGKEFDAEIVGRDPKTDLALIRIAPSGDLKPLPLGDSDALKVGEWVVAIGSPFGLEQTVTAGIVSAKGRVIGAGPYDDFIQTDASINPGNSGGPLLDMEGRVVGINTAIVASGQGIGFAIPIDMARNIIDQLKTEGVVNRGWLGVSIQDVTSELKEYYDLKSDSGVLVTEVHEGQPAERDGIEQGDVIISVDGKAVEDARDLSATIAGLPVGKAVDIRLVREGRERTVEVTLGRRADGERAIGAAPGTGETKNGEQLGLSFTDLTPQMARQLGLDADGGVVVSGVESDSKADEAGFQRGDLILELNRKRVDDVQDLKKALNGVKSGETVRFLIRRPRAGMMVISLER
jgi:serine protease Do